MKSHPLLQDVDRLGRQLPILHPQTNPHLLLLRHPKISPLGYPPHSVLSGEIGLEEQEGGRKGSGRADAFLPSLVHSLKGSEDRG